jgi:integrase
MSPRRRESLSRLSGKRSGGVKFSYLIYQSVFRVAKCIEYIEHHEIYFYRKKTVNKTKDKKEIVAPILEPMQRIIDRWGNDNTGNTVLIFPFCNECTTEEQYRHEIHNIIRLTNKQIKIISKALNLPDISTYSARHSYATILAKLRVPESYIAEQLGHANRTVTQNYFDNYTKKERIHYNSMLLN